MKTAYLMSKAISSALKRRKKFSSLSCTFWVIGLWRWRDRKKPKDKVLENSIFLTLYFLKTIFLVLFQRFFDFNTEIFKLNDRLRHLLFCLILGKEIWKCLMYLKDDQKTLRSCDLSFWKSNEFCGKLTYIEKITKKMLFSWFFRTL